MKWFLVRKRKEQPKSEDQAIAEALQKAEIALKTVNDKGFQSAYHDVIESFLDEWLITQPEEVERRESLYHQVNGLREIGFRLHTWIEAGAKIEPKLANFAPKDEKVEINYERTKH